jgi:hypothetical protein
LIRPVREIRASERLDWDWTLNWKIIVISLVGVVLGIRIASPTTIFAFMLMSILIFGFRTSEHVALRVRPNQGIWNSLMNGLRVWLAAGLVGGLMIGLVAQTAGDAGVTTNGNPLVGGALLIGIGIGLLFGVAGGFINGWLVVIRHITLLFFLWRQARIPGWRYDSFLNHMADKLGILQRVGGGYKFRHIELVNYLSKSPLRASEGSNVGQPVTD